MTKPEFLKILTQLYHAQTEGLIHNYTHNYLSPIISHQKHYHPIPNPKTTIFIAFTPTTTKSKKIALKDYFISTHSAEASLIAEEMILRVDIPRTTK